MGREIRMVPETWIHPKKNGRYVPLFDGYKKTLSDWIKGKELWGEGLRDNFKGGVTKHDSDMTYEEWDGEKPQPEDYMPEFPKGMATYYQMYETCSEGTPISPPMKTPEELARWLTDNEASAFGDMTATYENWLCTIKKGGAPSMYILKDNTLISGVEAICKKGDD
jgi:hypothetical protein